MSLPSITFPPASATRAACASLALLAFGAAPASALTLTDLSLVSNGGAFINNTIVDFTSPLAFTAPSLGAAFLNNADSTIELAYGNYFAYSFAGFGQHSGAGTVSGLQGGTPFSIAATFPADLSTAAVFFSHVFANGDTLTLGTTGLVADRIRIVANGDGMQPDGVNDAVYSFVYAPVPEPGAAAMLLAGLAVLGLLGRRRR